MRELEREMPVLQHDMGLCTGAIVVICYCDKMMGGVTKAKIKHVTTYQHTLAEGSSTPASCPLSTLPSLDPLVGNLGNRRK